jgi:putative Mg2+ transporter-C (MgtC) family protein
MISGTEIIIRLILGALIGGLVGFERQAHGRPAGFRTHMLVCVASVLIMIVSEYYHHLSVMDPTFVRVDPGRIAAGAITGVGFLGAGVILKMGATVSGLTTAACIWMVSAIGLAIGAGLYLASGVSFVITVISLVVFRALEERMPRLRFRHVVISASGDLKEDFINAALARHGLSTFDIDFERDFTTGEIVYRLTVALKRGMSTKALIDDLSSLEAIKKVSVRN